MLAARSRSGAPSGTDRLRSIRSRLTLGLLLPYVCLMGVCAIALFGGPATSNRIPAILVILAAAVLLPFAMARIARGIVSQVEALETERATLAAGQSVRDTQAGAPVDAVAEAPVDAVTETPVDAVAAAAVAALAERAADVAGESMNESAEPADAAGASVDVPPDAVDEIDENAPLAAAIEPGAARRSDPVVEDLGPFAALVAADRRVDAGSTLAAQAATNAVAEPVVAADEPIDDEPLAAAVDVETAEAPGPEQAEPDAAPRPVLMPSATSRQILTDTPAEPAA